MAMKGKLKVKGSAFQAVGRRLPFSRCETHRRDILATHASPNLAEYGGRYHASEEFEILGEVENRQPTTVDRAGT